jgi:hypothetical protein
MISRLAMVRQKMLWARKEESKRAGSSRTSGRSSQADW